MTKYPELAARLVSKVKIVGDCWLHQNAAKDYKGYPSVWAFGKRTRAHRAMFQAVHGMLDGPHQKVCHTCDTPACINPAHLWIGSDADNAQDKVYKGRSGHSALTREKLRQAQLGKKASPETKAKLSAMRKGEGNSFYGRKHSEATKLKISASKKGLHHGV